MRRAASVRAALVAVGVSLLAGCPLSSDRPLSDPATASPDPALVGTWRSVDPESAETTLLTILVFNSHEMVAVAPEPDRGRTSVMRLFTTKVGAETFLNAQDVGSDDSSWFLANYRVEKDTLRMKIVDDGLFKDRTFGSSDELRAFVGRNLSNPRLYTAADDTPSEITWDRVPPDAPGPSDGTGPKS